jgi:RecA-family ATPase
MPGEGKSSITMDLAARVTGGEPMPFCEGRRNSAGVVVFNSEDAKQVVRRRAIAAGADLGRMAILGAEAIGIFGNLRRLEAAIDKVAARLVVVDPVMAAFARRTNSKDDQSVRRELSPLAELAARTGAAILVVRHPTKAASGDPRYQGSGGVGITAALRSVLAVRERSDRPGERLLVHVKSNWGPLEKSVAYRIVSAGRAGRVDWLGEVALDVV